MASSSPRTWRYRVFASFHGPDVRKTFLSHLRKQFSCNGITMFDDQGIEKSQIIAPALTQAIRESRISIVVLSKNYASSSWCLDELLEILKCKEDIGQIVMTVFYGVDPSDVRKQTGEFGIAFNETCDGKTKEVSEKWIQALKIVGNIAGEHLLNWDNESRMIEKISKDVSNKLNTTISRDFEDMVGLEAHLEKIQSLLHLDNEDEAMVVGICGPAGIGKTTIARALYSRLSSSFQLTCFMENIRESSNSSLDEYGLKLRLQELLLSKILNQNGMMICHLGVIQERLCDNKVLIILDDVESLNQLEALTNEPSWFGPGSRVIVITDNKEILQQHGIKDAYHVDFPSREEALMIFCLSAFRRTSPPDGFLKLADEVARLCGDLPLGLHVLGSSLRGKSQGDWIDELPRLKNCLDGRIEKVLKVGYERLHEKDQALFLHIAVFFNFEPLDYVTTMLAKTKLNVRLGLKILSNKSLIQTSCCSKKRVVMHHLLQVMARKVISKQEPWERQILVDAKQIYYVLENAKGNGSILGISFDVSEMDELIISARAFERMVNLVFLKVYGGGSRLHIPEEMDYLPCLRLLHWEDYPRKNLPLRFCLENLVELHLRNSKLEKLWQGIQPLSSLKKMDLSRSYHLKKLPDLSNATNLEKLELNGCWSLVELPSSIVNLHKLKKLLMVCCIKLESVPTNINLASLERVNMGGCSRLKTFPDISTNIRELLISNTSLEVEPASFSLWSCLSYVDISDSGNLKTLTHVSENVAFLDLSYSGIEKIPDCIKGIHGLQHLKLAGCRKITSLPELPGSLTFLSADDCVALERVTSPSNTPHAKLNFSNCFKLNGETRKKIIQRSFLDGWACLPGKQVPAEFNHRAKGNSLTVHLEVKRLFSASCRFTACVMIAPNQQTRERSFDLRYRLIGKSGRPIYKDVIWVGLPRGSPGIGTEHLCIFHCDLPEEDICLEGGSEILFEFSCPLTLMEIFECGVRIDTDKTDIRSNESRLNQVYGRDDDGSYEFQPNKVSEDPDNSDCTDGICDLKSEKVSEEENTVEGKEHTNCCSWLFICFNLSHIVRNMLA